MKIELFTIQHCPGADGARRMLRKVLRDTGITFIETIIHDEEEAHVKGFLGSPTIQIDGEDIEIERQNDPPSFSCRTYQHKGPERRKALHDRRTHAERRDGWIRVSKWSSTKLHDLKISKYLH